MNAIRRLARVALLALAVSAATAAHAGTNDHAAGPRWACWYAAQTLTIDCLLSRLPTVAADAIAGNVDLHIDSRLPNIVRTIWSHPEYLADERITIPLLTVPYEMAFVAELAGSVMCGGRRDCSVRFDANPDGRAQLRAAAIRAGASEESILAELARQGIVLVAAAAMVDAATEEPKPSRRRRGLQG